jgi:hypothetical protein
MCKLLSPFYNILTLNSFSLQFPALTPRFLPIGTAHDNPILDSWMYEVEYQDDYKSAMAANAIAQNLFAQVDAEGNCQLRFDEIIDHRTNGKEVKQQDAFLTTRSGTRRQRETTIGFLTPWFNV